MSKNKDMTFWEHIYELRNRLLVVLAAILLFSIAGYILFPHIINIITKTIGEKLYTTTIAEGFLTKIKIAIITGVILAMPVFIIELILFIFPALTIKEKTILLAIIVSSSILFIFGVVFSFKIVLPISINFLKARDFFPENVDRLISYNTFILFFFQFLLCFGICFEFPIIFILLLKLKLIKMDFLTKNFKYFIIIIFIVAAILTPPDAFSQVMMAIPLVLLYLITILIAKIFKLGR
jgi:sec-independent protein translocase protein TatC